MPIEDSINDDEQTWQEWQEAAGEDTLKESGPISKEEHDYYINLLKSKSSIT